jgi:hypothetical protein
LIVVRCLAVRVIALHLRVNLPQLHLVLELANEHIEARHPVPYRVELLEHIELALRDLILHEDVLEIGIDEHLKLDEDVEYDVCDLERLNENNIIREQEIRSEYLPCSHEDLLHGLLMEFGEPMFMRNEQEALEIGYEPLKLVNGGVVLVLIEIQSTLEQ